MIAQRTFTTRLCPLVSGRRDSTLADLPAGGFSGTVSPAIANCFAAFLGSNESNATRTAVPARQHQSFSVCFPELG